MCIAIIKPATIPMPVEHLIEGQASNPDGCGYCFVNEYRQIVIRRSMTWKGFWKSYKRDVVRYGDTSDFLIHFRITSRGSTELDNCHPFRVDDKHAIIHNGTITKIKIAKDDRRSDTKIFATEYLANLPEGWEHNGVIAELIEEFIGYSKVCMLSVDTGITIFNESMGHWLDGIWYSNKSYIKATYTYKAPAAPVAVGYNNMYNHAYWWEKAAADDTIVGDDAEHWAPKQTTIPPVIPPIKETHLTSTESQQVLPLHGYEECDLCGDYNHANDLVKLSLGGIQIITCLNCVVSEPAFYCDACHEHTACNSVEISTDEGQQFGSKDLEAEDVYLCDDCLEMYKTAGFKIRIIESVMDAITKLAAKKW